MAMIDSMIQELEQETKTTRRLMERLPADRLDWRPHRKSFTLGQLALHIAGIAPGVAKLATQDTIPVPTFTSPAPASKEEVLEALERGLAEAKVTLGGFDDARMQGTWSAVKDGKAVLTMPRWMLLRAILLNQHYHHRGQLTVYLRQLDVPLPPVYGPTADEAAF